MAGGNLGLTWELSASIQYHRSTSDITLCYYLVGADCRTYWCIGTAWYVDRQATPKQREPEACYNGPDYREPSVKQARLVKTVKAS